MEDEDEEEENSEDDTEEEIMEFIENYAEFKQDMGSRIGNLTCVLTKLDMLDSALQVNLDFFLTDVWKQLDLSKSLAGRDAAWVHKVTQGYSDCYEIASNWPQQSLDRNPLMKIFGRHMVFFKCSMVSLPPLTHV